MKPTLKRIAFLAAAGTALAASNAGAANSFYAPGDLVLYFQQEGGSNTVYANLGNTATAFRGSAAGTAGDEGLSQANFLNISSSLQTAFGASWATQGNIYAGLAGVWGTSSTNTTLTNGDPHRTLYTAQGRGSVGTLGANDSPGYDLSLSSNTDMTTGASEMFAMNNAFETNGTLQHESMDTALSLIDEYNPFLAATIQGTAFGIFGGGVQQVGTAGIFGNIAGVGDVEFALDLYRIASRTDIVGQFGQGDPLRVGSFEGTITVGTDGQVSFLTAPIPEPSTTILAGLAAGAFCMRRRRTA